MRKLLATVALCCLVPVATAFAGPATLVLSDAWVRALPPGQPNTAAYLVIANSGDVPVSIIAASSPIAERVEMHTTREVDGYQRMELVAQVDLESGQRTEFAPGGTHLMLLGLSAMPDEGDEVRLCLQLAGGDEVCTRAAVRKSAGNEHQHHQH